MQTMKWRLENVRGRQWEVEGEVSFLKDRVERIWKLDENNEWNWEVEDATNKEEVFRRLEEMDSSVIVNAEKFVGNWRNSA